MVEISLYRRTEPIEKDLSLLVPVLGYVDPALEAMGVKPVVVDFRRVDPYETPSLNPA